MDVRSFAAFCQPSFEPNIMTTRGNNRGVKTELQQWRSIKGAQLPLTYVFSHTELSYKHREPPGAVVPYGKGAETSPLA